MTVQEKTDYKAHLKNLAISNSMLETAKFEGEDKKGRYAAGKLIQRGFANEDIADITGLPIETIAALRKEMN